LNVRLISPADIELDEAVSFYNHQSPGLGLRFFQEVDDAIERISFMPDAWQKVGKRTRRCLLKTFPYALFYILEPDLILITTIAHMHRDPEQFKDRLKQ
jgi:hypothetical protein